MVRRVMSKSLKLKGKKMVGSTGVEPATPTVSRPIKEELLNLDPSKRYKIPADFVAIPKMEWIEGRPTAYFVLGRSSLKRCDKGVTFRRKRSA